MTSVRRTGLLVFAVSALLAGCDCGGEVARSVPRVSVQPLSIDFGDRAVGSRTELELRLRNEGTAPLSISSLALSGNERNAFSLGVHPATIDVGVEVKVVVAYAPGVAAQDSTTIVVTTDDPIAPELLVSVVGRARDCPPEGCACIPKTCAEVDAACGEVSDGCGAIIDCGGCSLPEICGGAGVSNQCGSVPDGGSEDAGVELDAGTPEDGGIVDAGQPLTGCADGGVNGAIWRSQSMIGVPHVLWNGSEYALLWNERPAGQSLSAMEVWFARLSPSGALIPGSDVSVTGADGFASVHPKFDFSGAEYGVVYADDRFGSSSRKVYFRRVSAAGQPVSNSEVQVSATSGAQNDPQIAWSPGAQEWGIAWGQSGGSDGLWFQRHSATGAPVTGSKVQVSTDSGGIYATGNALAWSGSSWGLAHRTASGGFAIREISTSGTLGALIPIATGATVNPMRGSLASNGALWGVAWSDYRTGKYQARFALATVGGTYVSGTDLALGTAGNYSGEVTVAWNGQEFVVVWNEQSAETKEDVWLAKIDTSGNLVHKVQITSAINLEWWPSVAAANACNHAVIWERTPLSGTENEGRASFVP